MIYETHADKIAVVQCQLHQIAKDIEKLDPHSVEHMLWQVQDLLDFTTNILYTTSMEYQHETTYGDSLSVEDFAHSKSIICA